MMDQISAYLDPSRLNDVIGRYPEDWSAICDARGDEASLRLSFGMRLGRRRFGHADNIKQATSTACYCATSCRSFLESFSIFFRFSARSLVNMPFCNCCKSDCRELLSADKCSASS